MAAPVATMAGKKIPIQRSHERTFTGCLTCRSRRVKCDEQRPSCGVCKRQRLKCEGYDAKISWMPIAGIGNGRKRIGSPESSPGKGCRRVLYSETERSLMSREISQSVPWAAIDRVLGELETTTHSMEDSNGDLKIGPFGSFWTQPPLPVCGKLDEVVPEVDNQALDLLLFDDTFHLPDESALLEFGDTIGCPSLDFNFDWPDCSAPHAWPGDRPILSSLGPLDFHLPMVNRSELTDVIPPNAYYLMEHYRNQMVGLFSPIHVVQSPWKALHLPCASNALADLTLRGEAKEARTALFYAILSVSAFNLNKVNSEILAEGAEASMYWWEIGVSYREKAKKALQSCLRQERNGGAKSKYKEVLMALLSMITICVFSGQQHEARAYLLDAERWISLRGLPKASKSRKVIMLHHIFLFIRIIEESTFVYRPRTRPRRIENPSAATHQGDTMRFPSLATNAIANGDGTDIPSAVALDQNLVAGSSGGNWLFGDIYGIPEALLVLISHTTRLAHEATERRRHPTEQFHETDDFDKRAKVVENMICNWRPTAEPEASDDISATSNSELADFEPQDAVVHYLCRALHAALIIYFYRRVRGLHPLVLQHYVRETLEQLLLLEAAKAARGVFSGSISWPGFIAACEALSAELQERLLAWLRRAGFQSGMRSCDAAAEVARAVWRKRREGVEDVGWETVMEERNVALVLT